MIQMLGASISRLVGETKMAFLAPRMRNMLGARL